MKSIRTPTMTMSSAHPQMKEMWGTFWRANTKLPTDLGDGGALQTSWMTWIKRY